jgi:hypothetical protein
MKKINTGVITIFLAMTCITLLGAAGCAKQNDAASKPEIRNELISQAPKLTPDQQKRVDDAIKGRAARIAARNTPHPPTPQGQPQGQ